MATRSSRPPLWAMLLVAKVCADHGRRAPRISWWNGRSHWSSGRCHFESGIHITAGTSIEDQQLVILHEVAHFLTKPRRRPGKNMNWHSTRFWEKAFALYRQYGLTEYAVGRESSYKKKAAAIAATQILD